VRFTIRDMLLQAFSWITGVAGPSSIQP
jgi:hypothetical protein